MAQRPEHAPCETAPAAGTYEQLNIFGRPTGKRVNMMHGHPLPSAPLGHTWTLAEFMQEVSMTAEEFAEAIDKLITAAREGGLSDAKMIVALEEAVEGLDEGLSET